MNRQIGLEFTLRKHVIGRLIRLVTIITILLFFLFLLQVTIGLVRWDLFDYVAMGALLFVTGTGIELVLLKTSKPIYKVLGCIVLVGILALIWVELSVGILESPLSGS